MDNIAFLKSVGLFQDFVEEDLELFAAICRELVFNANDVVAYQRDVADRLIIVKSGRLAAVRTERDGHKTQVASYGPGDFFDDRWLFTAGTHQAMVTAMRDSHVLVIPSQAFLNLLNEYPELSQDLNLTPPARGEMRRNRVTLSRRRYGAIRLAPNEQVRFEARRSYWLLVLRSIFPVLGMFVLPILIYLGLNATLGFQSMGFIGIFLALLPILLLGMWILFIILDWSYDWFLVTDQNVIHYELDLRRFSTSISKSPVNQIQSVEIDTPNIFAYAFGVGTARITTAAQDTQIYFDFIDRPIDVQTIINELLEAYQQLDEGREQMVLRESMERHFEMPPMGRPVAPPPPPDFEAEEEEDDEFEDDEPTFLGSLWVLIRDYLATFHARTEENGVITYRKHIFVLLGDVKWPVAAALMNFIVYFVLARFTDRNALVTLLPLALIFAWFIWQLEDWRNDTYQLTDRYVIDIDRQPFGFRESRKQAELSNVQNATADKPTFLSNVLNYGSVTVETAGRTADITFENVADPIRVQSDIFGARSAYQRQQGRLAEEKRRQEYAVLLDVYKQASELNRIPNRTPFGELAIVNEEQASGANGDTVNIQDDYGADDYDLEDDLDDYDGS